MRTGFVGLLVTVLGAGSAMAQVPAMGQALLPPAYGGAGYPGVYMPVPDVPGLTDGGGEGFADTGRAQGCFPRNPLHDASWLSGEFLMWQIKKGPQPAPLVETGPADVFPSGFLGQPGAATVLGGQEFKYSTFSGGRLTGGFWFDPENPFMGAEASGFLLQRRSTSVGVNSDANGNPVLSAPFFFPSAQMESAIPLAAPGAFAGGLSLSSSSRPWGADANFLGLLYRGDSTRVTMLAGVRYLSLDETLVLGFRLTELPGGFLQFGGFIAPNLGTQATMTDNFLAHTDFYGGQLGARYEWYFSRFFLNLTAKTALGLSHERVEVSGVSTLLPAPGPDVFVGPTSLPGGIFSAGGNSGTFKGNKFAYLTELDTKFGMQIAYGFSAFIGYDVLFLNKVARVGDQINHSVDATRIPVSSDFVAGGGGAPPAQPVTQSSFWTQGLDIGLMFRY